MQVLIDLEDGHEPVVFNLDDFDGNRFIDFMGKCNRTEKALLLAKEMIVANGLDIPKIIEVIDAALIE